MAGLRQFQVRALCSHTNSATHLLSAVCEEAAVSGVAARCAACLCTLRLHCVCHDAINQRIRHHHHLFATRLVGHVCRTGRQSVLGVRVRGVGRRRSRGGGGDQKQRQDAQGHCGAVPGRLLVCLAQAALGHSAAGVGAVERSSGRQPRGGSRSAQTDSVGQNMKHGVPPILHAGVC